MDIFLLYLFTRVNDFRDIAGIGLLICGVAAIVFGVILLIFSDHWEFESARKIEFDEKKVSGAKKILKAIFFFLVPAFIAIKIFVPSQKDLAVIVGGHLAVEAVQSETAKKVYAIVEDALDEQLAEIAKRKEKK